MLIATSNLTYFLVLASEDLSVLDWALAVVGIIILGCLLIALLARLLFALDRMVCSQETRVGKTFKRLQEIYGEPNTSGSDEAFPDGHLTNLTMVDKVEGISPDDWKLAGLETSRLMHFSLPKLTITAFALPTEEIKNEYFYSEQCVGLNVAPIQGITFDHKDLKEIYETLTRCPAEFELQSPSYQDPEVYYSPDKRYIVSFWRKGQSAIRIIDRLLIHQAIDSKSKNNLTEGL